ncbi:Protein CBG25288 [Caenorhabditis briggsae]|uniref:Protein CBG25288 n=1 Tax=Caenorhabditis briggsae TaxID=6238 RepID=B6IF35_CAEBR|nr:Protein CBG25288 [Caenorhabditis briggsae]CAR98515.1 Protein CBG25288 [Caenorhabditis briggsae]
MQEQVQKRERRSLSSSVQQCPLCKRVCEQNADGQTGPFLFLYFSLSFIFYSSDLPLSTHPTLRKTIVGSESIDEWSPSSRATILGRRHD